MKILMNLYQSLQLNIKNMEGNASLPNIRQMYHSTRQNRDYNVIKHYQGPHKNFAIGTKATKKDHYLDIEIRYNCSPGPAHKANSIVTWAKKPLLQPKRGPKSTYLNDITKMQKKKNFPGANSYSLNMKWPQKINQHKEQQIPTKINFIDTCQYEADRIPGPGSYNIRTVISKGPQQKKWIPHPVEHKETLAAEVGTYNPCAVEYNTFDRINLKKEASHPSLPKKSPQKTKDKENRLPGPGAYATINFWQGKKPNKQNQRSYLKFIHKGPTSKVYY